MKRFYVCFLAVLLLMLVVSCDDNSTSPENDDPVIVPEVPESVIGKSYLLYYSIYDDIYPDVDKIVELNDNLILAQNADPEIGSPMVLHNLFQLGVVLLVTDGQIMSNADPENKKFNNEELDQILKDYPLEKMEFTEDRWLSFKLEFKRKYNSILLAEKFQGKPGIQSAFENSGGTYPEFWENISLEINGNVYRFIFDRHIMNQDELKNGTWVVEVEDGEATLISFTPYG